MKKRISIIALVALGVSLIYPLGWWFLYRQKNHTTEPYYFIVKNGSAIDLKVANVYWNRYRWDREKAEWYVDLMDSIYMRFNIVISTMSKTKIDDGHRIIRSVSDNVEEGQEYSVLYLYKENKPFVQLYKWRWYGPDISTAKDCFIK